MAGILLFPGPSQACFIVGDLNGDCRVDVEDLALAASQWMQASCDAETGLVAHWKLNETSGSTAVDSSGSGYNGIVAGASWNPAGGILGGALEFDGDTDYVWSSYRGITGSNPRTCAAWIKTDRPSGEIMTWGDRNTDAGRWVVRLDETGVLRLDTGGGYIVGTTVLTDDLWHHIAVASDGSTTDNIVLYVDGRIETTGGVVSQSINTQPSATTKLGVFQLPFMEGGYFDGLIDDARIYDRVLTAKEIWNLATTGTTSYSCPDLNADEVVNLKDLARLSRNWREETPPVLINEFLADNESKSPLGPGEILDGNYESSDWIELHNNSETVIDLGGCYLTDEAGLKTRWRFPSGMDQLVLQPGEYLIVFASGKTQEENPGNYPYVDPAGYLHTNFQLSKRGEYLALIAADGTTPIHEYNHFELGGDEYGYPRQEEGISYGFYYGEPRYFSEPTPGAANKSSFTGFAEKPDVNVRGGCYVNGFDLTLSCDTEGAFIRYTTDGTAPSLTNGSLYTGPIHIDGLTTLIAKSFKPGLRPSDARIETYIFVRSPVASFNSNLPIIVIDTLGVAIPSDKILKPYVDCRAVIVDVDDVTGRAAITGTGHFTGTGQIRLRGESTYGSNKGHYAFEIQDEYGRDKDVSLLGMPAESDWVINKEVIDYTLLKCEIAFKWFRDMGHYAPRQRFVEVYVNEDGGAISTSDYKGIFVLREKIKRSRNRVDIARLDSSHNLEPKVSGGYILKNDKYDTGDLLLKDYMEKAYYGINYDGAGKAILVEPDSLEITEPQINWITDYINEFHAVLWQNTSSSYYPGPGHHYSDYIDVTSWIDHFIVEQIAADADAFWGSYYAHKDRGGKICSGPPWDFDRSFHNNASSSQGYTTWKSNGAIFGKWHQKLQQDPEYRIMLADRWFEHRKVVLNTALTMAYIDEKAALMAEAMERTHAISGRFPRPFADEIALFKNWITNRLDWLDGEIASRFAGRPPVFSLSGGYVDKGDSLAMSRPPGVSGTIYYTLNGEDPRLEGGAVNPDAMIYSGSGQTVDSLVSMSSSVWKYLYDGSDQGTAWRDLSFNDSSWGSGPGQLGFGDNDETTDIGPKVNYRYTAYFRHAFTVTNVSGITDLSIDLLYDDGAVVYINGQEVRRIEMPTGTIDYSTPATGTTSDNKTTTFSVPVNILNEGDNIIAVEVHQRNYNSSDLSFDLALNATRPAGSSSGVVLNKTTCVRARIKNGSNWSAQNKEIYAVGPVLENLRITEMMYHPADPTPAEIAAVGQNLTDEDFEFIELQNTGDVAINLNLVRFTDGIDFTFGDYTLAAGEYAVLVKNHAAFAARYDTSGINTVPGGYIGSLDNAGEEIVLRDARGAEIHDFDYEDSWYELTDGDGFSLTMVDPAGSEPADWDAKSGWRASLYQGGTPGRAPQTVLAADSIVINELLAHSHAANPDWIELHNTTGQAIDIGGWFLSDNDSDRTNIMKYQFPDNTVIPAYGYLSLQEDETFGNPAAEGCNIPFGLSEGGETVYLYSGQNGEVSGFYQTQQKFDASETGVTLGRYEKAELSGGYDFVRQSAPSRDAVNNGPLVPAVVINEFYYNPSEGTGYEFVELYNRSASDVTLMRQVTTETSPGVFVTEDVAWRIEGIGYQFPDNTVIGAGQFILVAKNPATYSSAPCAVYGPYYGKLDNGGEELEIQIPGDKEYGRDRYWIPVEKIDYDDTAPWPTSADGAGDSLHRRDVSAYSRDYSNWQAATPTPGS